MKIGNPKKIIVPLPYPYYFWTVMFIALAGFFDSLYLAVSHYRNYADIGYQSFCAISSAINCDTVSQSPYSIFLNVPVPIWGMTAHAFFIALLMFGFPGSRDKKRMWTLLMTIALGFSVYCLILASISTFLIRSYCIMCILGYGVCFLLLYFSWLIRNRFNSEKLFTAIRLDIRQLLNLRRISLPVLSSFPIGMLLIFLFLPPYWQLTPPELTMDVPRGITEDGHPWIGAQKPELTIVEFADYLCFPCKKNHFHLRRLIQKNPDKIRLVHRHFPMDHIINPLVTDTFHSGSAKLALLALYATKKDKFWQVNDLLFDIARKNEAVTISYIAESTGLDFQDMAYAFNDYDLWQILWKDIREGLQYGINATPGYIIDDQLYLGHVPPEILKKYL
ncbi:MAG: hypothetical protein C4548_15090 [Desulfobacteraceae bacterium]|nr:MAG: hypothetical protein C4548_15090 [Desulfobacteraceae bacterium]